MELLLTIFTNGDFNSLLRPELPGSARLLRKGKFLTNGRSARIQQKELPFFVVRASIILLFKHGQKRNGAKTTLDSISATMTVTGMP
jgi:hypothetical protein